jgi:carboxyl-terminal processing protease
MRATLALCVALIAPAALAAPVPGSGPFDAPAGPRPLRAQAREFARDLLAAADVISARYVRPVPREESLHAGLTALYEAAGAPVPRGLRDALKDAAEGKGPADEQEELVGELKGDAPNVPAADRAFLTLIEHAQENIGEIKELEGRDPMAVCCQAMAHGLDAYSDVVTPAEQRRNLGADAERDGYGLEVNDWPGGGPLVVQAVHPGGPAQRAGVRPGDVLTHLDGRPVAELTRADMLKLLRLPADPPKRNGEPEPVGPPPPPPPGGVSPPEEPEAGKPLKATFKRGEARSQPVVLDCERGRPETVLGVARDDDNAWQFYADRKRKLAHVRIAALQRGTAAELRQVVTRLRDDGARGLVLDLRWCPGGYLDDSADAARLFLGDGEVATVKARDKEDQVFRSTGEGAVTDLPLVVLVNGETSGGAELIAAALQDRGRALVVGQRTLGKGSIQTAAPLPGTRVVLKLTNGTILRPSGKPLQREPDAKPGDDWGVRPDDGLEFRVSPALARSLRADWQRQTLRPGGCNEALPMDDPDADPQRQAALEALLAPPAKKPAAEATKGD